MTSKTILLAHHDPATLERLTTELGARGYHVVGPAQTARMALALAAQIPARWALIGEKLAGRRHGRALARELRETWGVRTMMLREGAGAA